MQPLKRLLTRPTVITAAAVLGFLTHSAPSAFAELAWIWAKKKDADAVSVRRDFVLEGSIKSATLQVSADNGARILINDNFALSNPDWDQPSTAEVAKFLKSGKNTIRAEAKNEGGQAGFVARLRIKLEDGKEVVIETDSGWQAKAEGEGTWQPAQVMAKYGSAPWGDVFGGKPGNAEATAVSVAQPSEIQTLPGFTVELLHVVPKSEEGSWVSTTVDPKGRILACDQYGSLYRLTPPPLGSKQPAAVEKLSSTVGGAHGLLYAFDSLYVMVNEQGGRQGLWRLKDTNGDDRFDEEKQLRRIQGGGEHGPHAVRLSPDGNSLYIVSGNHTKLPDNMELSRSPRIWDEDQIVPRMWDANGHARGILAPGGYICKTDPDGASFELISYGYRNSYDMAFNSLGDIFTYDSDMEWDAGSPWYRPTRICLATSGSDLGWRSGSGKWPSYYPDSLPAVQDIGPGSPTGVESGAGAKFPARYQHAIFANDWTYGTMYAIHATPHGGAYKTEREEFLSGKPLPLTDLTVNPKDGALYFAIGGRRTQSAVYRVTYTGTESTAPAPAQTGTPELRLRQELESLHQGGNDPRTVAQAWPHLDHPDRWVRWAARIAVERQHPELWTGFLDAEKRPWAVIESTIAAAHAGLKAHRDRLLARLNGVDFAALDSSAQLALIRAYQLIVIRLGSPEGTARDQAIARLDAQFPAKQFDLNKELASTLITLGSPSATAKTLQLMSTARDEEITYASDALLARNSGYADAFTKASTSRPNQQQIAYAYALRAAKAGWTPALRRAYFAWFPRTAPWQGGNSFRGFLEMIRKDALATAVTDATERQALDTLSSKKDQAGAAPDFAPPKGPGQDYSLDELVKLVGGKLEGRDYKDGERLFHSAACFSCHRFNGSGGGVGPDLTASASRYSFRDLLENIVEPSKVISDQYGSEEVQLADGTTLIGRTYVENDRIHVIFDPRNPDEKETAELSKVKSRKPSPISLMPAGLLNALNAEEVLNLLAYIQSAGDPKHAAFKK